MFSKKIVGNIEDKREAGANKFFCNLKCSGEYRYKDIDSPFRKAAEKNRWTSENHPTSNIDEYSNFRYHMRKIKQRKLEYNVDVIYLKKLWEKQSGKCAISGIQLDLGQSNGGLGKQNPINLASLDRIDSSKGYMKDNIQFISTTLNYAKNNMNEADFRRGFRELCLSFLKT